MVSPQKTKKETTWTHWIATKACVCKLCCSIIICIGTRSMHILFLSLPSIYHSMLYNEEWTGKCQQGYLKKQQQHTFARVPFTVINFQKLPACIWMHHRFKFAQIMASVHCILVLICKYLKYRMPADKIANEWVQPVDDDTIYTYICIGWAHGLDDVCVCVWVRIKWIKTADIGIKYSWAAASQPCGNRQN